MAKYSKLKRIYFKQNLAAEQIVEITDEKLSHLKNVLRLRAHEKFRIFNEDDGEYLAEIIEISRRLMHCRIIEQFRQAHKPRPLTLALGIIKQDKFIEAIRAAVQLGVTDILPVMMDNSQNNISLNVDRIEKCIIETCEQCESTIIPKISEAISFDQMLANINNSWLYFADEQANITDIPEGQKNETQQNIGKHRQIVLIGPEGGFSTEEREKLLRMNSITRMSLGNNVLRTEIAAISAISIVQYLNQAGR